MPGKLNAGRSGLVKLIRPAYCMLGSAALITVPLIGTVTIAETLTLTKASNADKANFLISQFFLFRLYIF